MDTSVARAYDVTRVIPVHLTNSRDTVLDSIAECQYRLVTFPSDVKYQELHITIVEYHYLLVCRYYITTAVRTSDDLFVEVRSC